MATMKDTYSISEAQAQLAKLVRDVESGVPVRIRRRDETVAYVLSRERMEALAETLEILASPDAMKAIEKDRSGKGRYVALEKAGL
jgi:prevent-host-death family protein